MKIGFDYYGVVSHYEWMRDLAKEFLANGDSVHCITAADPQTTIEEQQAKVLELGIPFTAIHVVYAPSHEDAGERKAEVMKREGISVLFDDNPFIINVVRSHRLIGILIQG